MPSRAPASSSSDGGSACALFPNGAVECWGDGARGQLGVPPVARRASAAPIDNLPAVAEIGVGDGYACARAHTGQVFCWGSNRDGTSPDGALERRREPVVV